MTVPILELQRRARELGRIRIGQKGAKGQPVKLDRFRLTSHSETLIRKVASLYGGTPQEWTPAGGTPQWECLTDAQRIPIMVPPQPVTQWLETWTGGGCVHRCDGVTEAISGEPCDGGPLHDQAKPTTRLNVVLRDVEGVGVWRLESKGWNAAVELPDIAAFLSEVGGYVNGWLSLEERTSKSNGLTRHFIVPTIEVDVTPAELMAGGGKATPVETSARPALTAEPPVPVNYLAAASFASSAEDVRRIWQQAKEDGNLTEDLKQDLTRIAQQFNPPKPAEPEMDADQAWQQVLTVAGNQGINLEPLMEGFVKFSQGVTAEDATAADLLRYAEHLKSVQV